VNKAYNSDALASVHETASDLLDAGLIVRTTLRQFDELCLTPVAKLSADDIKAIRQQGLRSNSRSWSGKKGWRRFPKALGSLMFRSCSWSIICVSISNWQCG